jgi:hypothetical protein
MVKRQLSTLPKPVLDKVKEYIRNDIAKRNILKAFDALRVTMDEYSQKWSDYDIARMKGLDAGHRKADAPSKPDFKELAKKHGLTLAQTGLIAKAEAAATGIGLSLPAQVVGGQLRRGGSAPVWSYAFQSPLTFRPTMSADGESLYLFWKTEDQEEHTPKLTDKGVRDEVLHTWKMIHARELAEKQAKLLAEKAKKAKKPLKEVFAAESNLHVMLPTKFSWMTLNNVASFRGQQDIRLSSVAGVEMAGEDFMHTVFGLEPGQVGTAFNAPKTIVYVVRPGEFSPEYKVRLDQFKVDDFSKYAAVGSRERQQVMQAWFKNIQTTAGFKWTPGHDPKDQTATGRNAASQEPIDTDSDY